MESSKKVTFAIIGLGIIGPRHAKAVQVSPNATLLCVVSPRTEEARPVAAELGVPLFESVQDMLRNGKTIPDAAIVCTPNNTHLPVSSELLLAGIDVLVEKPVTADIASGKELIETAKKTGRKLAVGHHRRFNPYITATKRVLDENRIGRVIALNGLWTVYKPTSYFSPPAEWHAEKGKGGPMLINLIHEIDILQYLLGPIVRVSAEQTISQRGNEVEEGAAVLLRFESGVVGTFILSDAVVSNHGFESGTGENPIIAQSGKDFYRIFGGEGSVSVGGRVVLSKSVEGAKRSWGNVLKDEEVEVKREVVPFEEQVEDFVRVVRGEVEPRCSGEEGLRALVICEAVRRAMESGRAVDIPKE